jgi:hypothetical protein
MDTTPKTTNKKTVAKTAAVWVSAAARQLPERGEDGCYSLRLLLDFYSPSILATAIEKHGIYTKDRYGRTIHCTAKENTEQYERVLDVLADWQSEIDDPGHQYSWNSERYCDGSHPTERWLLPYKTITLLDEIQNTPMQLKETIEERRARLGWKGVLQEEAKKLVLMAEENGNPQWEKISKTLAAWALENDLKVGKTHPSGPYIKTHVISLNDWQDPIRQKYRKRPNHL